jgi:type VI secretion system protein ImpK
MQPAIANVVHPVLGYGLRLRQMADDREPFDLDQEQAVLQKLLLGEAEARRLPAYAGPDSVTGPPRSTAGGRGAAPFLGIRYLLVCWLDEVMAESPNGPHWNERKLETALYSTSDRAESFWEQLRRAEAQGAADATEVGFLCVMLGFRGTLRGQPEALQRWVGAVQGRIAKAHGQECPIPPEQDPPIDVPPRRGREHLQRLVLLWGTLLLVLVPLAALFAVRQALM